MFGWLGRKGAPEVRPCVPVWLAGEMDTGEFVRGYRARLEEVYRRNPVGLRSVRLVAGLTGSLPLFAEAGDPLTGSGQAAVELVRAGGLMEQLAAALLLHGNAYVRLVADGHDRPAELFAMRPERVSVTCGPDGWPSGYTYRGGGQLTRIARTDALGRRQVAHLKSLNPGDDHYGLGCLKAACPAASVHRAEQLEPGLYRLSRMIRGRRGTEWASSSHHAGEHFCLFNPAALVTIDVPAAATGAILSATANGVADVAPPPEAQRPVGGEAMRPPSVCHLRAWRDGSSVHLGWVRRSHRGWAWNDGVGVPSESFPEHYRVTVTGPDGQLELETGTPGATLDVASLPGEAGQTVEFQIHMTGPMAISRPRGISLIL